MPAIRGRDRKNVWAVIVGAVLVGAALFFTAGAAAGLATALPGFAGSTLGLTYGTIAQVGFALALNGVAALLTHTPEPSVDGNERQSFIFNGPRNLTQPGGPVPLIYGKTMVGTHTVSASLDVEMLSGGTGPKAVDHTIYMNNSKVTESIGAKDMLERAGNPRITHVNGTSLANGQNVTVNDIRAMLHTGNGTTTWDRLDLSYQGTQNAFNRANARTKFTVTLTWEGTSYTASILVNSNWSTEVRNER